MKYRIGTIPPLEIAPGFQARIVHSEQMSLAFVEVAAGSVLREHHHVHEQVTTVLEGQFELTVGGELFELSAGETVVIGSNVPHSGRAVSDCRIVDVFSPVREDFKGRQTY